MIGFDTFRCGWDTDAIRIITYYCLGLRIIALFSSAEHFWYFSKFWRGWKGPCGKLRIKYELLRSLRMWYVSLRNERIVADGLYVPSAESVSVCVTGALNQTQSLSGIHSPGSTQKMATTVPPAIRHFNDVSLVGRLWPDYVWYLGCSSILWLMAINLEAYVTKRQYWGPVFADCSWETSEHTLATHLHSGKLPTIRQSSHGSGVCKEHYA